MTDRFSLKPISEVAADVVNQDQIVVGHISQILGKIFLWMSPALDLEDLEQLVTLMQAFAIDVEYGS